MKVIFLGATIFCLLLNSKFLGQDRPTVHQEFVTVKSWSNCYFLNNTDLEELNKIVDREETILTKEDMEKTFVLNKLTKESEFYKQILINPKANSLKKLKVLLVDFTIPLSHGEYIFLAIFPEENMNWQNENKLKLEKDYIIILPIENVVIPM